MIEKLKFLSGDVNWLQFGGKWISKKHNNGEFDYWYVVELINMRDATGDESEYTYNISIRAVAPSEVPEDEKQSACGSCGSGGCEKLNEYPLEQQIEILHSYGIGACLWNKSGNNFKTLWKETHEEISKINMLFGFYMDRPENRIGSTGWDLIKGDIMRPIREYKEEII